jgi:hypothetical protein
VVDHQIRHPLAYVCGIASPLAAHLRHRIAVAAARHTS